MHPAYTYNTNGRRYFYGLCSEYIQSVSGYTTKDGREIYIGVLGPVRTGKSTFIKRFMDEMVLPYMEDEHARMRAQDELPQSAGGKTITTTEPKFIPNEAAKVRLNDDIEVSVRLIDCVGYMIDGAAGHMEEDAERMVKTPGRRKRFRLPRRQRSARIKSCGIIPPSVL